MKKLKVCAIDPGTTETAIVLWDGEKIHFKGKITNDEAISYVQTVECDIIACEHIQSFGISVGKEVFETGYMVGRFWQICLQRNLIWRRVFRLEVKLHHCHTTRANDSAIRTALIDRLGAPGKKKTPGPTFGVSADMWSALAIATLTLDTPNKNVSQHVPSVSPSTALGGDTSIGTGTNLNQNENASSITN